MENIPYSDSDLTFTGFEGAISTRVMNHPHRSFAFEVTFDLAHPRLIALGSQKPPLHFHPYQEEYVQVLTGCLAVEVNGREVILSPSDGEFCLRPWVDHRLYPPPIPSQDAQKEAASTLDSTTKFLLSGQQTLKAFKLDNVFFQSWYAYQDEVVIGGKKVDPIQVVSTFDAGGSYLSLPWWVPFRHRISQAVSILVGRWLGGLLRYQPFYREWLTEENWQLACEKMESSYFQRRFADRRHSS
ncbi:hypothetical protein F5Y00DRAFT_232639 [Daldinia vernicosa]|uniref:uncharacterized protein n=1 Tax=Daldinia vernicosa TaxID=114800 RepID=UPI0020079E3B|nr:uncharacterized protein F5Y00DRAFT_232639 [Daldinia vernicosa]KAI0850550.1 hypothetical protein F5Y00DRAFT_232639 [Daldinia vernicosa]